MLAQEALDLIGDTDPAEQGSAWSVIATAQAGQGNNPAAHAAYQRAVRLLEAAANWQEAVQVRRAWARQLNQAGRNDEAVHILEQAAELALRTAARTRH